jgi:LuxR family maltose regulon positive regulatory protein
MIARNTPQSVKSGADQLDSMQKILRKTHHRRLMVDVFGMQALLADAQGQESTTFEKLSKALSLAEPAGLVRPFLDLGNKMGKLLKGLTDQKTDDKYAEQILTAFKNEETGIVPDVSEDQSVDQFSLANHDLVDPLTKREIEILMILTKRYSNPEIAEKLFISPETVKRHLYNIYQKFGVENRQQAIDKAKSLGMI